MCPFNHEPAKAEILIDSPKVSLKALKPGVPKCPPHFIAAVHTLDPVLGQSKPNVYLVTQRVHFLLILLVASRKEGGKRKRCLQFSCFISK